MHVEAAIDAPLIFAGDRLGARISFVPTRRRQSSSSTLDPSGTAPAADESSAPVHLLSGYAMVQGSFRLGDMVLPDTFESTRNEGVVLGRRGIEYGSHGPQGLFAGVLGGLKQLVVRPSVVEEDDEADYPIFSTAQTLLFTDLELDEPVTYDLAIELPEQLPPTYRSRALVISYQLVVGFQKLTDSGRPATSQLFLPFRVYPALDPEPFDLTRPLIIPPALETKKGPSSVEMLGFIDDLLEKSEHDRQHRRKSSIEFSTRTDPPKVSYEIAKGSTKIATLHLARPAVRIGDAIVGVLKMSKQCLHITAFLELFEDIDSAVAAGSQQTYQTYARQALATYALDEVAIHLPLLYSTTPSLLTQQVKASWSLRLEFVGLVGPFFTNKDDGLMARDQLESETFTARIPLTVLAPDSGGHGTNKVWSFKDPVEAHS